jgi:hypothetical protein
MATDKIIKQVQGKIELKQREEALVEVSEMLGAIKTMDGLGQSLTVQTLLALDRMKENKMHETLGFTRFDDFLDEWPKSPMKSEKYYRKRKLLENEGVLLFDAMETLQLPASQRKQLKGQIQVEGDEIVVGSDRLPLTDISRLKAVLKDVAYSQEKQNKKINDLEKEIKDTKLKLVETVKAASKAKPDKEAGTPFGQALLMVLVAMNELAKEVGELDQDELRAQQDNCLSRIGEKTKQIMEAFKLQTAPPLKAGKGKGPIDVNELDDDLFDE